MIRIEESIFEQSAATKVLSNNSSTVPDGNDAFAVRYNADGSLQWARKFGGTTRDEANVIAFDGTSAVYVAGFFTGSADFTGDGISDVKSAGGSDSFLVKLNSATGETIWYRTFGGAGLEQVNDLSVFIGQVYMTGQFGDTVDFNPEAGVFTLAAGGKGRSRPTDAFVSCLESNGAFVTAWQMGGTDIDKAVSLQADAGGVSVLGDFRGTADFRPGTGTLNKTSAGQTDVFLARYSLTGSPAWVQTIGGAGYESASVWAISTSNDAIYVSGSFAGQLDLDPGSGSHVVDNGDTFTDALMARYSKTDGSFTWARTYGQLGKPETAGMSAVIDPLSGNVYFGGNFYGALDFTPQIPGDELVSAGDRDSLLVKLDPQGNFIDGWRFGGEGWDSAARPAGIVGNTVSVVGWIYPGTADFPTGNTLFNATGPDMYVMALDESASAPSALHAATIPVASVKQSLTVSQYEPIVANSLGRREEAVGGHLQVQGHDVEVVLTESLVAVSKIPRTKFLSWLTLFSFSSEIKEAIRKKAFLKANLERYEATSASLTAPHSTHLGAATEAAHTKLSNGLNKWPMSIGFLRVASR